MKDYYTLPWTCEQQDKARLILSWICLIGFPIMFFVAVYELTFVQVNNYYRIIAISSAVISLFLWLLALIDEFIRFPKFRCKCKDDKS